MHLLRFIKAFFLRYRYALDLSPSLLYTAAMQVIVIIQAVLAVCLSFCVLLQQRATGLSATFGGSGTIEVQRRGAERFLYQSTIVVAVVFFALIIVDWYV